MNKFNRKYLPLSNQDLEDQEPDNSSFPININDQIERSIPLVIKTSNFGILDNYDDDDTDTEKENKKIISLRKFRLKNRFCKIILRNLCYLFILCSIIMIIFLFWGGQTSISKIGNIFWSTPKQYSDWSFEIPSKGTESCIKLIDIDQDGLDDIIFGLAGSSDINIDIDSDNASTSMILALRGYDGTKLWSIKTKSEVFELNCNLIDINMDGEYDCIGAGRQRTLLAFNPTDGYVYWDSSYMKEINNNWNIYMPIVLPYDFDGDGVNEIVISTGGNPTYPSDVHEREAGLIMLISGSTGLLMGEVFELPDSKETYMSPVLHVQNDESAFLLFGNGGETVNGNLYIMSIRDFFKHIMRNQAVLKVPKFNGNFKSETFLKKRFKTDNKIKSLYILHESLTKGVMVPPVLADVNNDGIKDIFILSFDGTLLMLDGNDFKIIWQKSYECYETYTRLLFGLKFVGVNPNYFYEILKLQYFTISPAPGYFNSDNVLDFMVILNLGTFDYYIKSSVVIINGINGDILWQIETPRMAMVSPLTIQTNDSSNLRDLFFFRIQGIGGDISFNSIQQVFHGIEPQQPVDKGFIKKKLKRSADSKLSEKAKQSWEKCDKLIKGEGKDDLVNNKEAAALSIKKRPPDFNEKVHKPKCENEEFNNIYLKSYGLVIDRTLQDSPIVLFDANPELLIYNFTEKEKSKSPVQDSKCIVMESMERNTGALGYLTNNQDIDIVTIFTYGGMVRDDKENYVKMVNKIKILKQSLKKALENNSKLNQKVYDSSLVLKDKVSVNMLDKSITDLNFKDKQIWSSYMGLMSNSVF